MNMSFDRQALAAFLENEMSLDLSEVSDDDALFSTGLLDSFGMVELMSFIESSASIRMDPGDVTLENLDSVNRILAFVNQSAG
jgi:acyl carrier protein